MAIGENGVDWEVLRDLAAKTNRELARKLVQSFLKTLPNSLRELSAARSTKNREQLRFWAHQLKSSSGMVGALPLSQACSALEEAAEGMGDFTPKIESLADALLAQGEMALKEFHKNGEAKVDAMDLPAKTTAKA